MAHVLREDLVRFANCPLVTRIGGMPELERGTAVEVEILGMDESVSYTHLDVYKRQASAASRPGTSGLSRCQLGTIQRLSLIHIWKSRRTA